MPFVYHLSERPNSFPVNISFSHRICLPRSAAQSFAGFGASSAHAAPQHTHNKAANQQLAFQNVICLPRSNSLWRVCWPQNVIEYPCAVVAVGLKAIVLAGCWFFQLFRAADSGVSLNFSNLSTFSPEQLPTPTTCFAKFNAGILSTHSFVARNASKL